MLVLGGDIYPALGGDYSGNFALSSTQHLATNVTGITVPLSGHWIPEEQPKFVIEFCNQLIFLLNKSKGVNSTIVTTDGTATAQMMKI